MERMAAHGLRPDLCMVGEPTSSRRLGDVIKIGRRGPVNMWIHVDGVQGHVAYPHLADNPIQRLIRILSAIDALLLDEGNHWFKESRSEERRVGKEWVCTCRFWWTQYQSKKKQKK